MPSAKITSKGQVTLAKQVREQLRLEPGGLDTNLLLRYLTQDDPDQSRQANAFIADAPARLSPRRDAVAAPAAIVVEAPRARRSRSALAAGQNSLLGEPPKGSCPFGWRALPAARLG